MQNHGLKHQLVIRPGCPLDHKFISLAQVVLARYSLTVQNPGLKHHSFHSISNVDVIYMWMNAFFLLLCNGLISCGMTIEGTGSQIISPRAFRWDGREDVQGIVMNIDIP